MQAKTLPQHVSSCVLIHRIQAKLMHEVGFEPTQLTLPGLKSGSLDHSDIRAKKYYTLYNIYITTYNSNSSLNALLENIIEK